MKRTAFGVLVVLLLLAAVCLKFGRRVWIERYLLAANMTSGWIVIETDNSSCPLFDNHGIVREIHISESGYTCVSSPVDTNWLHREYYLVDNQGTRSKIDDNNMIHMSGSFGIDNYKLIGTNPAIKGPCRFHGEAFWYGPKGTVNGSPATVAARFHPECVLN